MSRLKPVRHRSQCLVVLSENSWRWDQQPLTSVLLRSRRCGYAPGKVRSSFERGSFARLCSRPAWPAVFPLLTAFVAAPETAVAVGSLVGPSDTAVRDHDDGWPSTESSRHRALSRPARFHAFRRDGKDTGKREVSSCRVWFRAPVKDDRHLLLDGVHGDPHSGVFRHQRVELSLRTSRTRDVRTTSPLGYRNVRRRPGPMSPGPNLAVLEAEPYNVTATGSGQCFGWPLRSASHPSRVSSRY